MSDFEDLYSKYGQDGMIDYERGETNEFWGDKTKALEDYKNAETHFPMEQWQVFHKVHNDSEYEYLTEDAVITQTSPSQFHFQSVL